MRRARNNFDSTEVMQHCFRSFMLPILEYAYVVWCSAAVGHLAVLYQIFNGCSQLIDDVVVGGFQTGSGSTDFKLPPAHFG